MTYHTIHLREDEFFTYSSPCQDWSNAGLQRGGVEGSGTRSSLLWECRRAILAKKPKYLMLENVKALVSGKFKPFFNKWEQELASYGYTNFWRVLNSKDYGIPQNRERVFLISILDCDEDFRFGDPYELPIRLKDMLEEKVDEKYYLDDEKVQKFIEHCDRKQAEGCGFKFEPTVGGGLDTEICPTITINSWQNNCFLVEIDEDTEDSSSEESK